MKILIRFSKSYRFFNKRSMKQIHHTLPLHPDGNFLNKRVSYRVMECIKGTFRLRFKDVNI